MNRAYGLVHVLANILMLKYDVDGCETKGLNSAIPIERYGILH